MSYFGFYCFIAVDIKPASKKKNVNFKQYLILPIWCSIVNRCCAIVRLGRHLIKNCITFSPGLSPRECAFYWLPNSSFRLIYTLSKSIYLKLNSVQNILYLIQDN